MEEGVRGKKWRRLFFDCNYRRPFILGLRRCGAERELGPTPCDPTSETTVRVAVPVKQGLTRREQPFRALALLGERSGASVRKNKAVGHQ